MPVDELGEALKAFLRLGIFIGLGGLVLVLLVPAGTAEQVLSVCSAALGAAIVVGVVVIKRVMD